ncbi:MAG TPA: hypothetical protein ENK46_10100 [Flavobacteriia bacterium]|jgi:hypothetical protein|nr:hypothetical protein [Flavobacteriia bacterium]
MSDKIILNTLRQDLKNISKENFNEKIIHQLNLSKKKEKPILFNQKSIIKGFIIVSIFVLIASLNIVEKLPQQFVIIGILICISPLFLIVFNKIHQTIIENS